MKFKLLFLILILPALLSGCKKDKTDPVIAIKKDIVGTWQSQSFLDVYYDASGKEVNRTETPDDGDTKLTFSSDGYVNVPSTPDKSSNYTLTNVDGKVMLEFGGGPSYETQINGNTMLWILNKDVKGDNYVRMVTTIQFKRI